MSNVCGNCGRAYEGALCGYCMDGWPKPKPKRTSKRWRIPCFLLLMFLALFGPTCHASVAFAQGVLPPSPIACSSETPYGCFPAQLFAPVIVAGSGNVQASTSELQQSRYYVPYAPYRHIPVKHFGTIYGVVRCPNGSVVGNAIIYFKRADNSIITSGTANGLGEYIISTAQVGTQGYLTWAGQTLTGLVTIEATAQRIDLTVPDLGGIGVCSNATSS